MFFISIKRKKGQTRSRQSQQITPDLYAFHALFLCSNCSQKRASTKVIEAMFYSSGTERSASLWEGSAALTVVKRDEREGV